MNLITVNNNEFIEIPLIPIEQKGKRFYIASVPFKSLKDIFTVQPAEYVIDREIAIAKEHSDDATYLKSLREKLELEQKGFQRVADPERLKEIKEFLLKEEYSVFPNTIIAACEILDDAFAIYSDEDYSSAFVENKAILKCENERYVLHVPKKNSVVLIIDGQHRIEGLSAAYKADSERLGEYSLVLSLFLGYDRPTIAKLFYTINYTQKSVNKSLLYHLMGEFSGGVDETTFLHEMVKLLNELDKSNFFKRIKMLGKTPKDLPAAEKERMTISQAFLIDSLAPTISRSRINSIYAPIFLMYYREKEKHIDIIRFLIRYFKAVEIVVPDWANPDKAMISKSVGVGSLVKLMQVLFVKLFVEDLAMSPDRIRDLTVDMLASKLKGLEKIDYSPSGPHGKAASGASIDKLYREMVSKLECFGGKTYEDFLPTYKSIYKARFQEWLLANVSPVTK